ncbi:hypothetical protein LCGC14_1974820, partial [marine sediment metagenome]
DRMTAPVEAKDLETWSEVAEHWLHHVEKGLGLNIGILVVIVAAGYFTLKLIRALKGK